MAWMIGIDEAGYGPNLGPLVVAATAWRVGEKGPGVRDQGAGSGALAVLAPSARTIAPPINLYTRLAHIVSPKPTDGRLAIADSKALYKPGSGLRLLERGVLSALGAVGPLFQILDASARWQLLWDASLADPEGRRHGLPWYADYDCPLPIDSSADEISDATALLDNGCKNVDVQLTTVRARAVFPREFNDLTEHHGTKGAALSHISIALLKEVLENLPPAPCPLPTAHYSITFDKHGGRNRYAALLQHHFPDQWIETLHESRPASHYQWGPPESRVEVCFRTKGEAELPTALASMTAKYHRELAMRAFNTYWSAKIPGLRPTAGYPVDAKRFKTDIATKQQELDISDRNLWRSR